ncbi:MAG: TMEM14 family protein [Ardenticatenaceae bacterium]|nr:TMEM14 family protein [Ardenticatenaceae bacterium]HBY98115.1 hypothetical protein [Chloroflexota bacterium]
MIRQLARIALPIYGVVLFVGGLMGYRRGQSRQSFIAGSISGLLTLVAAALAGRYPRLANGLAAGIALALTAMMGQRWKKTGHVMPAGIIAALSGGVATLTTSALLRA